MYNSEEEIDDIVVKPTNFSTRETLKKQVNSTPKSTIPSISMPIDNKIEKDVSSKSNFKPIDEEFEFYDENFQKTTNNLKEKYKDFLKNGNSMSTKKISIEENENENYEDDFESIENENLAIKAPLRDNIRNNYDFDEYYQNDSNGFSGNGLPEYGEDLPPNFPTIDLNENEFIDLENVNANPSPQKVIKKPAIETKLQANLLSFGAKEYLDNSKSPKRVEGDISILSQDISREKVTTAHFSTIKKDGSVSKTPKSPIPSDQYTINNYNIFFDENKKNGKNETIETQKKKENITPKKPNVSIDQAKRNPVPPIKKSALTPHGKRENPSSKTPEKEDLLNKSDISGIRTRPRRTQNRYEDIKRIELPTIRNEHSNSRTRNNSDETNRYRPGRLLFREKQKEKSQDRKDESILVQDIHKQDIERLKPEMPVNLGENLSTDMNSATDISHVAERDRDSSISRIIDRLLVRQSANLTPPHKSVSSSTKVKSIISERYFTERVEHLLSVDLKNKTDQEIIIHNNVLRRYVNETKEDLRRILGKALSSNRGTPSGRYVSPHMKIGRIQEDINLNQNLIISYAKEAESLAKTLRKATDMTYLAELDSKIEQIQSKIKRVQKEKKEFDLINKKELYLYLGNNFLEPVIIEQDKSKMNKLNQKTDTYDLLVRDIKILKKRNKGANILIEEQTEHLSDMNERFNKLKDIAVHFGIILDAKKKKNIENLQKKSLELSRAISIIERSIMQKSKQYQFELNKIQSEFIQEKKQLKKNHKNLERINNENESLKKEIEEHERYMYFSNLREKKYKESNILEDDRFRVTQNETSTMGLDTDKDDLDFEGNVLRPRKNGDSSAAKIDSETDHALRSGEDFMNEEEEELIKKVQEEEERKQAEGIFEEEENKGKETVLDIQQINKMSLDQKIDLPEANNKFEEIRKIKFLFQNDDPKNSYMTYQNYSVTQEFKIIQEPTFSMEDRPELLFSGMENSIRKNTKNQHSRIALSKNNSIASSNIYTIEHKNFSKITHTQISDDNEAEDSSISSPTRKKDEYTSGTKPSDDSNPSNLIQFDQKTLNYKINGNFDIRDSHEALKIPRSDKIVSQQKSSKDNDSEIASTQRYDIRGSVSSNEPTVKNIHTNLPPTLEGSPVSDLTSKITGKEKSSMVLNLETKITPTNKKLQQKISINESIRSDINSPIQEKNKETSDVEEYFESHRTKEALTTLENPIVTETKSSIPNQEKFNGLLNFQANGIVAHHHLKEESIKVQTLNSVELQQTNTIPSNLKKNENSDIKTPNLKSQTPIKKQELTLSSLPQDNTKSAIINKPQPSKDSFDFFDNFKDIDQIDYASKGKQIFGKDIKPESTITQKEANDFKLDHKESSIIENSDYNFEKSSNIKLDMYEQPQIITQPRGGMPRRMKIGDDPQKKKETDFARKAEKDGNDFFTDFGF